MPPPLPHPVRRTVLTMQEHTFLSLPCGYARDTQSSHPCPIEHRSAYQSDGSGPDHTDDPPRKSPSGAQQRKRRSR
ncbi:hypothetical protein SCOCK_160220 [Actinacidiphila cocklensis]|uniref:Uncharacterized protein n=1 Tax=Actinacidiphila cocklensis TaxID=887465 RepID=A0A9W4DR03_9ACTN|nr:hypothetical protein SCOCK_160220 [Actinacidiphila cocklensis]